MSIFVSLPAYRDVEAQHTIQCLFDTAARPERVSVGVFHQCKPGDEIDRIGYARPLQVRITKAFVPHKFVINESLGS